VSRLSTEAQASITDSIDPQVDQQARERWGCEFLAGVDEVGRGPWAGPVTAAAVIFDPERVPMGLRDSKKLTARQRSSLAQEIEAVAVSFAVIHVPPAEIDRINVLQATFTAMMQALSALEPAAQAVLVDGRQLPPSLNLPAQAIVGGDDQSHSIAAASILAKVARDTHMVALSQQYPGYGWDTNVGYGTAQHQKGLETYGVTPHHRRSFKPIHNILWPQK